MQFLVASIGWYPIFALPVWCCIGLTRLFRPLRVRLRLSDYLLTILPWIVWFALLAIRARLKSLTNVAMETVGLGLIAAVAFLFRCIAEALLPHCGKAAAWVATISGCLAPGLEYALVPPLPE